MSSTAGPGGHGGGGEISASPSGGDRQASAWLVWSEIRCGLGHIILFLSFCQNALISGHGGGEKEEAEAAAAAALVLHRRAGAEIFSRAVEPGAEQGRLRR